MAYSYVHAEYGDLFGLTPNDLTEQQLSKISVQKLIEFIDLDSRVDSVLESKVVNTINGNDFLKSIIPERVTYIPNTAAKYNQIIRAGQTDIDDLISKSYYVRRENFVFWNILDIENKVEECRRWTEDKITTFSTDKIELDEIYPVAPDVCEKMLVHSVTKNVGAARIIKRAPKEVLLKYLEDPIFKAHKGIYEHVLSNEHTPDEYVSKALRAIAGRSKNLPQINVTLSKAILSELPPVMRLALFETLFYEMNGIGIKFKDINSPEDLHSLLLGVSIHKNTRVIKLLNRFTSMCEWRKKNEHV
jgi:hypothetical protein